MTHIGWSTWSSYYDSDADLSVLADKTIVFFGYAFRVIQRPFVAYCFTISFGNQGAAQAQNLRDSGIPNDNIIIANREDDYAADAKSRGFNVTHDFGKAAEAADGEYIHLVTPLSPPDAELYSSFPSHPVCSYSWDRVPSILIAPQWSGSASRLQQASRPEAERFCYHRGC